ncbi:hypothetical protein F5883DRAFT_623963 [Diaporthe sp. PMI_573]|nr:hypothetical protein F5883DRAFT_623963 [Diaporthaceae sp. PMI_573]
MDLQLAPGIVVLNKRYFSRDPLVAAQVGASSFTFSVLRVLLDYNILSGIVLYSRDEKLATVKLPHPIVYYQTDTLLQYHPRGYRFCVTHHGPFASHFAQEFSPDLARLSFGGAQDKADILCEQQHLGIQRLLQDNQGTVLAHSRLQQRILESAGLNSTRFIYLHPPIGIPLCNDPTILPRSMQGFIRGADLLLFTAVARLDYFKNAELVVQSGLELLKMGVSARTLVVGDPEGDSSRRAALLESVPADKRGHFMVCPRLAKDQLYALFTAAARHNGVFLCPSRYETLGITPLEAAAAGVATLVTETPNVEALAFMPTGCSVPQDASCIAARVAAMSRDDGIPVWAERVRRHVRPATSLEGFRDDLLAAVFRPCRF